MTLERDELLRSDLTTWQIGPYHEALPGPMLLKLVLDGEIIVAGGVETGFLHKSLEKAIELHSWQAALPYSDRLDPESAVFGELALCLAVEQIADTIVPERAQRVRVILSELARIASHFAHFVKMARAVGADTVQYYVMRDRERILDLLELLTGARYSISFLRYGGVRADVTEGFIERVLEACELIRVRLKEYNDIFTFNQAYIKRTHGVGRASQELLRRYGVTGPVARASGIPFDVRKAHPYSGFEQLDFAVPTGPNEGGDSHDRFLQRLREVAQSLSILKDVAEHMPQGEFNNGPVGPDHVVPEGEVFSRIESARGLLGCHVISTGGRAPARVQFRTPSRAALTMIPELIVGHGIEDLPVVLGSLDINLSEADR